MPDKDVENELLNDITGHEVDDDNSNDNDDLDLDDLNDDDAAPDNDDDQGDDDQGDDDDSGSDDQNDPPLAGKTKGKQPGKPDTTVVRQPDIYDPRTKLEDRNGSLYLNGKMIAAAGRERRNFEGARRVIGAERQQNRKMASRLQELSGAARDLYTRYTTLEKNKNMFESAGLNFDEQKLMFDVATAYKKNPLDGIKLMLTKAKLAGVGIEQLGVAGNGIDLSAIVSEIKSHVDERLKPVSDMTADRAAQAELEHQVNGFFDRNPEAETFAETLNGGAKALGQILMRARETDIANGRKPQTIDQYWEKLHYEVLKRGGVTSVVTQRREQKPLREPGQPRHRRRRSISGDESYADIGKSVLADIKNL